MPSDIRDQGRFTSKSRQVLRAELRDKYYGMFRVAPDARGTKANPIAPRKSRRQLARALAARDFKAGVTA